MAVAYPHQPHHAEVPSELSNISFGILSAEVDFIQKHPAVLDEIKHALEVELGKSAYIQTEEGSVNPDSNTIDFNLDFYSGFSQMSEITPEIIDLDDDDMDMDRIDYQDNDTFRIAVESVFNKMKAELGNLTYAEFYKLVSPFFLKHSESREYIYLSMEDISKPELNLAQTEA